MEQSVIELFLPAGILEYFDLTSVEKSSENYTIYLGPAEKVSSANDILKIQGVENWLRGHILQANFHLELNHIPNTHSVMLKKFGSNYLPNRIAPWSI